MAKGCGCTSKNASKSTAQRMRERANKAAQNAQAAGRTQRSVSFSRKF